MSTVGLGGSPLVQYRRLLVAHRDLLNRAIQRDENALRVLRYRLRDVLHWVDRRNWLRRTGHQLSKKRAYTRRDEQRLNLQRGLREGFVPACRVGILLRRMERAGEAEYKFRSALDESRQDGTASVVCPLLEKAYQSYERMLMAARAISQDDPGKQEFRAAEADLNEAVVSIQRFTAPSPAGPGPDAVPDNPPDPTAYVLISTRFPDKYESSRDCMKALADVFIPWNEGRTQGRIRYWKPSSQRFAVHAVDWDEYHRQRNLDDVDELKVTAEEIAEVEERKRRLRVSKRW